MKEKRDIGIYDSKEYAMQEGRNKGGEEKRRNKEVEKIREGKAVFEHTWKGRRYFITIATMEGTPGLLKKS